MNDWKTSATLQVLVFICLIISLAGHLGGIFGHAWWILKENAAGLNIKFSYGILRSCINNHLKNECKFRTNIFKFKYLTQLDGKQH